MTGSVWAVKIALLSANLTTDVLGVDGWSAENMLYKIGDNIVTCGTLARIGDGSNVLMPTLVAKCQFSRYDLRNR